IVVLQTLMYGMETFWDRQVEMRQILQVWINRGLRKILEAVRTTPVDAMLGEMGMKRVELELEKKNGKLAEEVKEKMEEPGGVYEGEIIGRILRGLKENKLEGERWEVESERVGKIRWKVNKGGAEKNGEKIWDTGGRYMREKWKQ
ncbi:hypothetical protein C7212DRAFT_308682, partial [Tuber magnatum]